MSTYPTQDLSEIAAGHDGPPIPESKRIYFQERWKWRFFDFLLGRFEEAERNGLNQAKLARRIGKSAEVVNRWLSAPSNLTLESMSDMLLGISAEEPAIDGVSVLNRARTNYSHTEDLKAEAETEGTGKLELRRAA